MFWQEDPDKGEQQAADEILDLVFSIQCRRLPVDHARALSRALIEAVPWLGREPRAGIHTVHVAGSQNGWERPAHDSGEYLVLSHRTKLAIRVPAERAEELRRELHGVALDVAGCPLKVGDGKPRPLSRQTTIFSRYVAMRPDHRDEDAFLRWAAGELAAMGIRIRKALCGKTLTLDGPDGPLPARSLMLAELRPEESVRLQENGLGPHRHMGCGIFIPHKGIEAVKKTTDD